jgi:galactonate dehydratase
MIDCGMYWGRVGIGHTVIAGIEAALWDLKGKMYGVPVYELLGGKCHDQLPCYATGGASNWPLEKLLEKMDFYASLGFKGLKVGTGYHDPGRGQFGGKTLAENVDMEASKAEAMRNHAGPDLRIALDGHMGFRHGADRWTVPIAKAVLHAVEPYDIHFFEEPLAYVDPRGYAELAGSTSIRVAGGEQLTAIEEWRHYIDVGAFDMAQPDAAWNGISDFLEIGRMMAQRGGWVASHAWAAGGGTMQNIHAAFATPNTLVLEIPPAAGPLHTEVWGDSFQMVDGEVLPPTAPGLGIRLADDLKDRFPYRPGAEEWVSVPGKICRS